jgi:peptide/nickel transport system substrate-binding protein
VISPFRSANQSIYCSYTDAGNCGNNWDHAADPRVDALFSRALSTLNQTQATALYNQIDGLLWSDMVTLPLFQDPDLYGWSSSYGNIVPNNSNVGITWNANQWGVR